MDSKERKESQRVTGRAIHTAARRLRAWCHSGLQIIRNAAEKRRDAAGASSGSGQKLHARPKTPLYQEVLTLDHPGCEMSGNLPRDRSPRLNMRRR